MLKTVKDVNIKGKKVLVRCDFNVPLEKGRITDDNRIKKALPAIKNLLDGGASVILMSHLGRPKGEKVDELSLKPVAGRLGELLNVDVKFNGSTTGSSAKKVASELKPGEVYLLENLRFNSGEKENDPGFARDLADLADLFVQNAFGTAHRKHASMVGVPDYLESVAGELIQKEVDYLSRGLTPDNPFVVCLGGAKIASKIGVIQNMLDKADTILIGGGMTYTLLKAKGVQVGNSLVDEDNIKTAEEILSRAKNSQAELMLPVDQVASDDFDNPQRVENIEGNRIPRDMMGMDIGPQTAKLYEEKLSAAQTVVFNGPMGVFEKDRFTGGTQAVLRGVKKATQSGGTTLLGGGDTVSAVKKFGFSESDFSHVSTGGGASLTFLEGSPLPGIEVLKN
ncbi:MAG: phosphoglycerate kinase [Elusimicrobiota bacterium]